MTLSNFSVAGNGGRRPSRGRNGAPPGPGTVLVTLPSQNGESRSDTGNPPKAWVRSAEQTIIVVGTRVRALRQSKKLTLRDVAEQTGVSVSMLSMLERGVSTASVATLVAVASAFDVHMHELFFLNAADGDSPVTRLNEQTNHQMGRGATQRIAQHDSTAGVELTVNTYEPGGTSETMTTRHDRREFGVLISGRLTIESGAESHILDPGDVFVVSPDRSTRIASSSGERGVAVCVSITGRVG
jgi:transcriptional regulator with XRE-family HTH domain